MPEMSVSSASLAWAGGSLGIEPVYFAASPASLTWTGGDINIGPSILLAVEEQSVRLDRLQRGVGIVDKEGRPSLQFQQREQNVAKRIEEAFKLQGAAIAELQRILNVALAAQSTAAAAAQEVVEVQSTVDLANSRPSPVDGLLSASSSGTVTIAGHDRVYSDAHTVAVDGGSVSGFSPGQFVRVFYVDAAREGGAVAYQGTTAEVTQTGSTHVVGGVLIPEVGQPPVTGTGPTPPGFVRDPNVADP